MRSVVSQLHSCRVTRCLFGVVFIGIATVYLYSCAWQKIPSEIAQTNLSVAQKRQLAKLSHLSSVGLDELEVSRHTGLPRLLRFHIPHESLPGETDLERSRYFLKAYAQLYRLDNVDAISPISEVPIILGDCRLIRFQQVLGEWPVWGSQISLLYAHDASLLGVLANYFPDLEKPQAPRLTMIQARELAFGDSSYQQRAAHRGELAVLPKQFGGDSEAMSRIVWHFQLPYPRTDLRRNVFVDAHDGTVMTIDTPARDVLDEDCRLHSEPLPQFHVNEVTNAIDALLLQDDVHLDDTAAKEIEPVDTVYNFLSRHPQLFLTAKPRRQLKVQDVRSDAFGLAHVVMRQYYAGLPVFGALMSFAVSPSGEVVSVLGRYIPGLDVGREAELSSNAAKDLALKHLKWLSCHDGCDKDAVKAALDGIHQETLQTTLGIFPGQLVQGLEQRHRLSNRLAWRVELPGWLMFVDGKNSQLLLAAPTTASQTVHVYNADGESEVDYVPEVFLPLTEESNEGDAGAARRFAQNTVDYFRDGSQAGLFPIVYERPEPWDANDGDIYLITNLRDLSNNLLDPPIACAWVPNAHSVPSLGVTPSYTAYCPAMARGGDVVTHEQFHDIIRKTADLIYVGESGALNESYCDVFGELINGDPAVPWINGEVPASLINLPTAPPFFLVRNMAEPGEPDPVTSLAAQDQPGHMDDYFFTDDPDVNCPTLETCDHGFVHTNSGIGNRAAFLLANAIGNDKLAALHFYALNVYLAPWAGFSDLMLGAYSSCLTWLNAGREDTFSPLLSEEDCLAVREAYARVGVVPVLQTGWRHHPAPGEARGHETWFSGRRLYNGCTLHDVRIRVRTPDGERYAAAGNNYRYDFHGEFGVRLAADNWHQGTDRLDVTVNWWHNSFQSVIYDVLPILDHGPNVTEDAECYSPFGTSWIELRSSWREHPYDILHADDYDVVRPSGWSPEHRMAPQCGEGLAVELERQDTDGHIEPLVSHDGDAVGAYFTRQPVHSTAGIDLAVTVRWWTGWGEAIRYRVVYKINQPGQGIDCRRPIL